MKCIQTPKTCIMGAEYSEFFSSLGAGLAAWLQNNITWKEKKYLANCKLAFYVINAQYYYMHINVDQKLKTFI